MGRKVTIQDIADALGLSRNTVSKAINNSEGLAESTKKLIIDNRTKIDISISDNNLLKHYFKILLRKLQI